MLLVSAATLLPTLRLDVLSIKASWSELTMRRDSRLDILDVFRVVAIVWVAINHLGSEGRIDVLERLPSAKAWKDSVHNDPIFGALLGNSALGVEIFLVLSGLLAARSWNRKADSSFAPHCASFLVKRWFRLFPVVAAFIFIAAGPLVKAALPRYHSTMIETCGSRGIAAHLMLVGNWQSTPTCMGYLWYLGLDMQLYVLAPFVLHLLYRRPRLAVAGIAFLVSVSALMRAVYCQVYGMCNRSDVDIPFISYPGQNPETLKAIYEGIWEMYGRPHTKMGPFLIGLLLGFITNKLKIQLPELIAARLYYGGAALAVAVIYAILPEYWYPEQGNTVYNTLYTALFRTVFAGAVSAMIFGLYYGSKRPQVSQFWAVFARLTFTAYLVHMPCIYVFNHLEFLQQATSAVELLAVLPFVLALSFATAFVFYVFVESPFGRLSTQAMKTIGL
ncbi:CRE-RHY-1 protein [Aphelenchoides avenae]|nr:CRE-RHY-1 protein [Aphelenchus avenae]